MHVLKAEDRSSIFDSRHETAGATCREEYLDLKSEAGMEISRWFDFNVS